MHRINYKSWNILKAKSDAEKLYFCGEKSLWTVLVKLLDSINYAAGSDHYFRSWCLFVRPKNVLDFIYEGAHIHS